MSDEEGGLRRRTLLTVGVAVGCLVYVVLSWTFRRSAALPPVTAAAAIVPLGMALGLVLAGRRVRATVRGVARRPIEALAAYRTLRLGQACALAGAATAGGYLAYVVMAWPDVDAASVRSAAIAAGIIAGSGLVLMGSGLWVEAMCRIDPPADRSRRGGSDAGPGEARGPLSADPDADDGFGHWH